MQAKLDSGRDRSGAARRHPWSSVHDYYGIFTSGPVTVTGGGNHFIEVTAQFGSAPTF